MHFCAPFAEFWKWLKWCFGFWVGLLFDFVIIITNSNWKFQWFLKGTFTWIELACYLPKLNFSFSLNRKKLLNIFQISRHFHLFRRFHRFVAYSILCHFHSQSFIFSVSRRKPFHSLSNFYKKNSQNKFNLVTFRLQLSKVDEIHGVVNRNIRVDKLLSWYTQLFPWITTFFIVKLYFIPKYSVAFAVATSVQRVSLLCISMLLSHTIVLSVPLLHVELLLLCVRCCALTKLSITWILITFHLKSAQHTKEREKTGGGL